MFCCTILQCCQILSRAFAFYTERSGRPAISGRIIGVAFAAVIPRATDAAAA